MIVRACPTYKKLLRECFATDKALLEQWHIDAGKGLKACVNRTYSDMRKSRGLTVFGVYSGEAEILVGYFGRETTKFGQFLSGFFLLPEYRTRAGKEQFWACVRTKFEGKFACGLYDKNEPAKSFIRKCGGIELQRGTFKGDRFVIYGLEA